MILKLFVNAYLYFRGILTGQGPLNLPLFSSGGQSPILWRADIKVVIKAKGFFSLNAFSALMEKKVSKVAP